MDNQGPVIFFLNPVFGHISEPTEYTMSGGGLVQNFGIRPHI